MMLAMHIVALRHYHSKKRKVYIGMKRNQQKNSNLDRVAWRKVNVNPRHVQAKTWNYVLNSREIEGNSQ